MKFVKKLGLGLSIAVISLSAILTLLLAVVPASPPVSAQAGCPDSSEAGPINATIGCHMHPYEAAQIYQAYWAFWHCAQGEWRTDQPISQLRDADLFEHNIQYRPTYIRASDNSLGNCHNAANIGPMFNDMEIDPFTYLTTDTGSGPIYTADGTRYNVNGNVSREARVRHLANMIQSQHQLDVTSGRAQTAQQYFVVKAHFEERCIEDDNVPTTAGGTAVRIVSNDGTEGTVNVLVRSRNNDDVGYGLNGIDASSNSAGARISCADMANLMNTYADLAIQRIAEWRGYNPDAEIPAGEAGGTEEEDNSCESAGGTLGWIMCPIAGLLDSVVGFLDENIRKLLYVDQNYFDTGGASGSALKVAWSQFRNIAYIILIPIMLVMVIGTALGFEVFSAYTIKKALPRMVIAVIFITLSWYICVFLVNFFNVIGGGITNIVTAPFSDIHSAAGESSRSPLKGALDAAGITQTGDGWVQSVTSGTAATTLGIVGTAGLFAAGALSLGIIMSTLATAALILGGIFLLLIVRQMLVIALALLAPLAILAWIFPGNDKMWKLWWGSFSKLLMLYPLITLLIGVGQVFAYVTGVARVGDNQLVTVIIIIGSFLMPFFFIPFAFKWAGGVFGNLAGMVNDRERGVLDRLRKGRAETRAKGWQSFKAGTGENFGQRSALAKNIGARVGVGTRGRFGIGERGAQALDQHSRQAGVENVMKNPAWNGINQNDDALHAATYSSAAAAQEGLRERFRNEIKQSDIDKLMNEEGISDTAARARLEADADNRAQRAAAAVQASVGFGRPQAIAAAQQLVSTGTGYSDLNDMVTTLSRAAGGNSNTASALAGFANSETKKTGRHDMAPGFGTLNGLVQQSIGGATTENNAEFDRSMQAAARSTTQSSSLYELLNGKTNSLENQAEAHLQALRSDSANQEDKLNASAFFKEIRENLPNAKGGNRDAIMKILSGEGARWQGSQEAILQFDSQQTTKEVVNVDPATGATTRATQTVTNADLANARKRAYERPDPNRTP